jgi:hypothetical protein
MLNQIHRISIVSFLLLSASCKGDTGAGNGTGGQSGSASGGAAGGLSNTGGGSALTGGKSNVGGTGGTGTGKTGGTGTGQTGGTGGTAATGGTGGSKTGGVGGTAATGGTGGSKTGGMGGTAATGGTGGSKTGGMGGTNVGGLAGSRTRVRAFLSGHSLLDSPIDTYVVDIATKKGDDYRYNLQNIVGSPIRIRTRGSNPLSNADFGGYRLGKNLNGTGMNVINELRTPATLGQGEKYDTLVITERHDLPDSIQWESTTSLLRHYHDRLLAGNASGQTSLYHCWQSMNKDNPSAWLAYEKAATPLWECVASKVNLTLEANNLPKAVLNLPASKAMVVLVERAIAGEVPGVSGSTREKMNAFFADDVHLTNLGAYFAASVIYSGLFRKTPEGAAIPNGLAQNTAVYLQKLAWEQVQMYYNTPGAGERTMPQCRTIAATACPLFWTLMGDAGKAASCANFWNDANSANNPFRWPDSQLVVWPEP